MSFEITAQVLRGDDGNVTGISIVAGGETYSEDFVSRFPRALRAKEATLAIEGGKVVLEGPTFSGRAGKFEFSPTPEELDGLKTSIFAAGKRRIFKSTMSLSAGFQFVVAA